MEYHTDEIGNVIILKEATTGYEEQEPLMIQGHMDMVAVKKPDCKKDMEKEGLEVCVEGDDFYARDTSLGGDDGIAVAMGLALLSSETLKHPRLEVVITVDEEVGMDGARAIDLSVCRAKRMLNLDSEEEGFFLAGCAGGARVHSMLPIQKAEITGDLYEIRIGGLQGGHSGTEINKGRGNANCLLGRVLLELSEAVTFQLVNMEGGLADNAIPREAAATLVILENDRETQIKKCLDRVEADLKNEFAVTDIGVKIEMAKKGKQAAACTSQEDTQKVIRLLTAFPNGIQAMNPSIPGMVETSLNLGVLRTTTDGYCFTFAVRSAITSAKRALIAQTIAAAKLAGAESEVTGDYPGWAFRTQSAFRDKMIRVYEEMFGEIPMVQTMHAGLECGLFMEKKPDLDCVSMGPNIYNIHTTEERLSISSTQRVWKFVKALVETC